MASHVVGQPQPVDTALLDLLQSRDGLLTRVLLADGRRLSVYDIAWGYDIGDEHAHVTTNVSPGCEGRPIDFFFRSEVTGLLDKSGRSLAVP